jgi:hypothetical protein
MTRSAGWRATSILAVGGGLGFWLANFAISRTPIAAVYRAGVSIAYVPMLVEALVGGLIIGFGVSFALLRFHDKIPTRSPILKALLLSLVALVAVTVLLEAPAKLLSAGPDPMRYFLIGTLFNAIRIPALGLVVGLLYDRVSESVTEVH